MIEKKKDEKALSTRGTSALSLDVNFGKDAGAGTADTVQDRVIPLMALLQPLSPQVMKGNEKYVKGAEPGMLINKGTKKFYEVREGESVILVPIDCQKWFMEYRKRKQGGGYRGKHLPTDPMIVSLTGGRKVFGKLQHPTIDDNEIVETNFVPVLVLDAPSGNIIDAAVIAFKSTQLGDWTEWSSLLTSTIVSVNGKEMELREAAPMFAHQIRVTAKFTSNDKGDFWRFVLTPAMEDEDGNPNILSSMILDQEHPVYQKARQLFQEFGAGQRTFEHEQAEDDEAPAGKSVFEK